ncbi:tetratricopeptide repeat protein [Leptospira fainei serovar Hurstbridge str. BUT 6]|uniref:Tetratricopeptide repeat protein n=1 Tax=Leptospira fainei serovar Hurstbridge str. BUT 6 TaxID=1193011 RepID=S3UXZ6_9LEPT|nr:tetratricopeptide repeat protein [Leptospira fainei]EPG74088.1 tetratricopeptide repeat protein [Leptospira fainei serovar Hurstbridge str. BUT 6]
MKLPPVLNKNFLFIFLALFLTAACASRDFRKSTSQDAVLEKDLFTRQSIKRASKLINEGNSAFQKGKFDVSLEKGNQSIAVYPMAEGYYLVGSSEYKLGKSEEALKALKKGTELDPENEQILLTLGILYTAQGSNNEAVEVYAKLEKLPKIDAASYTFKKAVLLKTIGRYEDAYAALKTIPEDKFKFRAQLYMQLGDTAVQLKEYDEAEKYFEKARATDPELASAKQSASATRVASMLEKGNSALKSKNYKEAIVHFTAATQTDSKNPSPLVFLGNAKILAGDLDGAVKAFESSLRLKADYWEAYSGLAAAYNKSGNYPKAISTLEKAIPFFPKNAAVYNQIGLNQKALGEKARAMVSFTRARELDPAYKEPVLNLVYLLTSENRFKTARNELDTLKQDEEVKKVRSFLDVAELIYEGDQRLRKGDTKSARSYYEQAKVKDVNDPSVYTAFGRSYQISGDQKLSEQNFQKALALQKGNLPALQGLIRLYSSQKNQSKVAQYTKELEALTGNDPTSGIVLARTYEDKKEYEKAEGAYKNLLKKFPSNDAVQFRLAHLYYKLSLEENEKANYDSASTWLTKAEKLVKDLPELAEARQTIEQNRRFAEVIPSIRKANRFFDLKSYDKALPLYQTAYDKTKKLTLYIKIAECHLAMGNEEKGIYLLENSPEGSKNLASQEAINAFLLRKGEVDKAEKGFRKILEKKPDSYYSQYQLGIVYLQRQKYDSAIESFNRAWLLNPEFSAAKIGKGIAYYNGGKTKEAREEFESAMKSDSDNELAPYNIGIVLFNDNLLDQAANIFKDIIKKNPDFPDAYYQLSYIYFKRGDLESADAEIVKALDLERDEKFIHARIRILSELKQKNPGKAEYKKIALELGRELAEKYPNSPYSSHAERLVLSDDDSPVIIQPFPNRGALVGVPVVINDVLIMNYGTSLEALDKNRAIRIWRIATTKPYKSVIADKRVYVFTDKTLEIRDQNSGSLFNSLSLAGNFRKAQISGDRIIIETESSGKKTLTSYNDTFENRQTLSLEAKAWTVSRNGKILVQTVSGKENRIALLDANLSGSPQVAWSGKISIEPKLLGSSDDGAFYRIGDQILYISGNGKVSKSDAKDPALSLFSVRGNALWYAGKESLFRLEAGSSVPQNIKIQGKPLEGLLPGKAGDCILLYTDNTAVRYNNKGESIWTYSITQDKDSVYSLLYR